MAATLVSGCGSWFGKKQDAGEVAAPDVIYGRADAMLDQQSYESAAKQYEEVDINHPYSQEARRAIVMAAYAYYKAGKYDDAVSSADRYLTLHPGTPESDLAQNIIGMSYYVQVLDPKRDQTNARKALQAYQTLVQRYPESRYAAEAQNRARILRDTIRPFMQDKAVIERFEKAGSQVAYLDGPEFARFLEADTDRLLKVVRQIGLS